MHHSCEKQPAAQLLVLSDAPALRLRLVPCLRRHISSTTGVGANANRDQTLLAWPQPLAQGLACSGQTAPTASTTASASVLKVRRPVPSAHVMHHSVTALL